MTAAAFISKLPPFTPAGVLPPFFGTYPSNRLEQQSPYLCAFPEFSSRFGFNEFRRRLVNNAIVYNRELAELGIVHGFQIIGGSFVEQVEKPRDIDLVTCFRRPMSHSTPAEMLDLIDKNRALFDNEKIQARLQIDCNFVDLDIDPSDASIFVGRWISRFSMSTPPRKWKGIVIVPLAGATATAMDGPARND
jgi:hypothetical protein